MSTRDADAIVIGAGHNGLVTAAYLAKSGMRTILLEARDRVGGTAASEPYAGATVNICNCDHLTFRTTPVREELALDSFGLRYLDVEPAQINMTWREQQPWPSFHDLDRTLDALAVLHPGEVDGYRRYARAAIPAARMALDAANDPPTLRGLTRKAVRHRMQGLTTVFSWSRQSAAAIMRRYFATEALRAPGLAVGPMVWGISPELRGSGLGALTYAMRHVATVGRPVGGSGAVPDALAAAFAHHGGELRTRARVASIVCDGHGARGVRLSTGDELRADVIVSACDPRRTFVDWLSSPPSSASGLIARWRAHPHTQGYESKIDAILDEAPRLRAVAAEPFASLGVDGAGATLALAPSLAEMDRGAALMNDGQILERPGLIVNVPTVIDPTMAPAGQHVLSLETIYTPHNFHGGWDDRAEPRRWLERYADVVEPGFLESIRAWRVMTPNSYESEFNLPKGHATSFAGGPLAALRNADPELTRYETAVPGLYLTGAATFPGAGVWGASGRNAAAVILGRHGG